MSLLIGILALGLLALVIFVVGAPLRAARRPQEELPAGQVEAAREAKYREIRDAEMDFRTGKLSREDYEAVDAALRTEAVEILDRLEAPDDGAPEA